MNMVLNSLTHEYDFLLLLSVLLLSVNTANFERILFILKSNIAQCNFPYMYYSFIDFTLFFRVFSSRVIERTENIPRESRRKIEDIKLKFNRYSNGERRWFQHVELPIGASMNSIEIYRICSDV